MSLTIADLFSTPDYYPMAFDAGDTVFATMNRASYARSVFLDGRIARTTPNNIRAPNAALATMHARTRLPRQRIGWIFHVAHCGSTLLARALDRPDGPLVLREPMMLRQLGITAGGSRDAVWRDRLDLTLALAGRRYRPDAPTIIKANVPVNFIIPDIMAAAASDPAILLYYPFETYLLAILRTPNHRGWVQSVTTELHSFLSATVGDIAGLDAVERAAALWLAQMLIYADTLASCPNSYSLDAETLFAHPQAVIAAASTLFESPMTGEQIVALVASELFATNAKNPGMAFDNAARLARQAERAHGMADDIVRARQWLAHAPALARLPPALDRALLGAGAPLLIG